MDGTWLSIKVRQDQKERCHLDQELRVGIFKLPLHEEPEARYLRKGDRVLTEGLLPSLDVFLVPDNAVVEVCAQEFAEKTNKPEVWTELGKAQLDQGMLREAIDSFIKAQNPSMYMMVINLAQTQECFEELVQFLTMARKTLKEKVVTKTS